MTDAGVRVEAGHVLDERYLLEKEIGRGGMGTVFAARHLELEENVAIKVLQTGSALVTLEAEHLERFVREARLAAKIKNEHVVRVIDVARGKNGSPPYIVMELLDGMDLAAVIEKEGRVPIPTAVDYVLQACEALADAHALGIVHRDLKSSNLHRSNHADGTFTVKVLDFGISKTGDEAGDTNLTVTGAIFGSPAYMSPEQIRSAKHVDARTDVWAMGVVLFELVTDKLPFRGETAASMLAAISVDTPKSFQELGLTAPGLEQAILAALAKNRDERTPTIADFAASIAPFGGPSAAPSLAKIQRALNRTPSQNGSAPMPAAVVVASSSKNDVNTGPVDDTVRASDVVFEKKPSPSGPVEPAVARSGSSVTGTDREMVVSQRLPSSSLGGLVGLVGGVVAVTATIVFFVMRGQTAPAPAAPPVVAPPSAVLPAPVPPVPAERVEAPPASTQAPSTQAPTYKPVAPPRPAAQSVATPVTSGSAHAKPNFDHRL